jgi:hypothetical protein
MALCSGCFIFAERASPRLIKGQNIFVQIEEEMLVVKIQTRSDPKRYSGVDNVIIGIGDSALWLKEKYMTMRDVSKHYIHGDLFVVEIDMPRIMYRLRRFNRISITLNTLHIGQQQERYVYSSGEFIYDELGKPYLPPLPVVHVGKETVVIKIQPRFRLEWYRGVRRVHICDRLSGQCVDLYHGYKQYVHDGLIVVEIDKLMGYPRLAGFTDIVVTLDNGEADIYSYTSEDFIPLTEELKD